ncbi:hypothetical protein GGR27_003099 [Lewinella antarctica]|uniref:F5/8 type C domain-containing protein n=2 Tax=Neolewinella antarctica TaxID=442734 RepID=A0ABX0XED6_9BACT|nr:hypothetical protein [Neolewinella antarctica]
MHAISGNMSKKGLTKDLEAIAEVGIGGVLLFNVSEGIPAGKVTYNSPEHHAMLKHAARECDRLGLTFGFHNCDGWSSSGGPWITPENSMKMVVWSETVVDGGHIDTPLAQPTTRRDFYGDIAVLAYPSLPSELVDYEAKPVVTSSDKNLDVAKIMDADPTSETTIAGENPWIQFDYGKQHTVRSFFMNVEDRWASAELWTSDDGTNFTLVKDLYKQKTVHQQLDFSDSFEPVTARYFRIKLTRVNTIREISLKSVATIGKLLARTGINRIDDYKLTPIGNPRAEMIVKPDEIIDLTDKMDDSGNLTATLPAGKFTILRFGYTTNGLQNTPASPEGQGLECDKFSKKALKVHFDAFITKAIDNLADTESMQYIEIDSYEKGMQNWTDSLDAIFREKKGYDLTQFLPLFAGRFVESAETSDAVLGDFRQVTCDLTTENYYGYFTELCHERGLQTYFEPYGDGLINELDVAAKADINMGEFWLERDVRMMNAAVSGSRIYGKNLISAEAFTSIPKLNWKGHPAAVKLKGDSAWTDGVNQFMLHRFAHQANTHVTPGMTLGFWGFHFDRTNTWWHNAGAEWFKYMARGSYLLRQGNPVSDVLVFIGEDAPNAPFYRDEFDPHIPIETNFDCINADALINRIQIKGDRLALPEGLEYQVLVLKNCEKLSLESLTKIHEIALAGIPIAGLTSIEPQGYNVSDELREQFALLLAEIKSQTKIYDHYDWSTIFHENNIATDLDFIGREDMGYTHRTMADKDIYFFYNREKEAALFECAFRVDGKIPELWNSVNGEITKLGQFKHQDGRTTAWITLEAEESVFVVFRESSKGVPSVSLGQNKDLRVEYTLDDDNQLVLNASRNGTYAASMTNGENRKTVIDQIDNPVTIAGSWEVAFPKVNGDKAKFVFDELIDWKDNADDAIRYYSGTAIYRNSFLFNQPKLSENQHWILDLGEVNVIARVKLNGVDLGVLWLPPFKVDVSDALIEGENKLEIHVTNQWTNHLIGDEQFAQTDGYKITNEKMPDWYVNNEPPPSGERTTFTTYPFYKKDSPLISAGLLGPVTLNERQKFMLKE